MLREMVLEKGDKCLVSTLTGEVKYDVSPVEWGDVKYRKCIDDLDISNPEALMEWIEEGRYTNRVDEVSELVMDKGLSAIELKVLLFLGGEVVGQNITYTTVKDIIDKLCIEKTQVSRALKGLEDKHFITMEHKNTFGVGSRVVSVHPRYFWKGNYAVRSKYEAIWYRKYTPNAHEILYSCPYSVD